MPKSAVTLDLPYPGELNRARAWEPTTASEREAHCFHCGTASKDSGISKDGKLFCCNGCLAVYDLLTEHGLDGFYELNVSIGVKGARPAKSAQFDYLDEPAVRERLVDFSDARLTRVTFHIPAIHCIACMWLLENLFRLKPGLGRSQVNFPKKEVAIAFDTSRVRLSEVVALLASLGYEPELKLSDVAIRPKRKEFRRLWLQLGVAGFAFGNTMLFSVPAYFGLDTGSGPGFQKLTGWISLGLALPVVIYSALDYWRSAWMSWRGRTLNIEVPIAAGLLALFGQSTFEVVTGRGTGYFDSLTGLLFFLLCGRLFQQKTFDRLAFDRDFRSFFPLSVTRCEGETERRVALSEVQVGDRLVVRHGELIAADARLSSGTAWIDYSFVTGESAPVEKTAGDYLYAGGRQIGGAVEVQTIKPVSQSYLASLWGQEAFQKEDRGESLNNLTNRYSRRFTVSVLAIAIGAAAVWSLIDPRIAVKAFTSVLIVACPCALALAAPFALGTAQRLLASRRVFLKSPVVLERLAVADCMVFDKTGTLTAGSGDPIFQGRTLSSDERRWLRSLTRHSTHPYAVRLRSTLEPATDKDVHDFSETPGAGIAGQVEGHFIRMGSARWLGIRAGSPETSLSTRIATGGEDDRASASAGSVVHLEIDGAWRGWFEFPGSVRPEADRLLASLASDYRLSLLSGDHALERERFRALFGSKAELRFGQSPFDKLGYVRKLQEAGHTVVMVGDGLNDAGALKQSDVGVAVVENIGAFSPASDVIMSGDMVPHVGRLASFSKAAVRVVRASFVISSIYNVVGIAIAARGLLSPVVCAILMPLSSITVVAFACFSTNWCARRILNSEPAPLLPEPGTVPRTSAGGSS